MEEGIGSPTRAVDADAPLEPAGAAAEAVEVVEVVEAADAVVTANVIS
jgi:hypothetical protein